MHQEVSFLYFLDCGLLIPRSQQRRPGDARTWEQRLEFEAQQWDSQAPALAQAYLCYKHPTAAPVRTVSSSSFQVQAIHLFSRSVVSVPQHPNELANVALLHMGYIGCSPQRPSVAISLEVLDLYYRLRRRHPQLGLQAFTRVLCDLHNVRTPLIAITLELIKLQVTYQPFLRRQLSIAFDVYLATLRGIETDANVGLERSAREWRLRNACAACGPEVSK